MNVAASPTSVIGIYGAGKSGVAIARLALVAGYDVKVATSAPASETALIADIVAPGAKAVETGDVADGSDIVIIAVPLRKFRDLPLEQLAGRVVVDVMNYWPPIDGVLPEFEDAGRPSSVVVQAALPPTARVVKTFNHLGYHQMEDLARPAGAPDRAALAVAGDDPGAVETVSAFVDRLGFDPVSAGPLARSAALQPETPVFGSHLSAEEMLQEIERA
jgi:predicted dinucleotide-binding enzyme